MRAPGIKRWKVVVETTISTHVWEGIWETTANRAKAYATRRVKNVAPSGKIRKVSVELLDD